MGVFTGLIIALDVASSTETKKKQEIKKLILNNDGVISYAVTKQCHFLVTNVPEKVADSFKCRIATKYSIPVVSLEYLYKCSQEQSIVDLKQYQVGADNLSLQLQKGVISSQSDSSNKQKNYVPSAVTSGSLKTWRLGEANIPYFDEENYELVDFAIFSQQVDDYSIKKPSKSSFHVVEIHVGVPTKAEENNRNSSSVFLSKTTQSSFYRIFTQSGFISNGKFDQSCDKKEMRFTDNVDVALSVFSKLCQQHLTSSLELLQNCSSDLLNAGIGSTKLQLKLEKQRLLKEPDEEVVRFVEEIWHESLGCLEEILSVPFSSIKINQIEKAESNLVHMRQRFNERRDAKDLEEEFYKLIPHKTIVEINNKQLVAKKLELCQLIRDLISVSESSRGSPLNPSLSKYKSLRCAMRTLNGKEFDDVQNLVMSSLLKDMPGRKKYPGLNIEKILKVNRLAELQDFSSNVGNVKLMFHSTKPEHVVGILSRGLLLPKTVVEELGGVLTDVGRLGGGIYFAESASISSKYSRQSKTSGARVMFVNSVALGSTKEVFEEQVGATEAPKGFNSLIGVAKWRDSQSVFEDDEYVVYSTNQQKLEYVIEYQIEGDVKPHSLGGFCDAETGFLVDADGISKEISELNMSDVTNVKDPMEKMKSGLMSRSSEELLPMGSVNVFVRMIDLVAEVVILQEYTNYSDEVIEAKYVFPLDEKAAVCGFEAFVNNKHIIGKVKEKQEAHREYKEAISKGHGAYLMDQDEKVQDLFTISVGNLPARCNAVIKITYVTELTVEDESVTFRLPASVAPWKLEEAYESTVQLVTGKLGDHLEDAKPIKTRVQVSIEMPFDIKSITSPSHTIRIKKTDTKAMVEMAQSESLDEGFILLVSLAQIHVPRMWVEKHPSLKDSRACMLTFYPEFDSLNLNNSEVVFLLDQSRSMFESSAIISARKVLLLILQLLPSSCSFNVIIFGTEFTKLFVSCKPKSEEALKDSETFLKKHTLTMGNSEIHSLLHCYHLLSSPMVTRNIVVITDGYLDNESGILKVVGSFPEKTRLFALSAGSIVNSHSLQNITRLGRGAYVHFDNQFKSKWCAKVKDLIEKLGQPSVSNIKVEWQNFNNCKDIIQAPTYISALFNGYRQVVYGFVPDCTLATLKANVSGREISTTVSTSELNITTGQMIHQLTAKAVIQDWLCGMMAQNKLQDEVMKQVKKNYIINLSIQHSIVTSYTSFVAVEEREKDEQFSETQLAKLLDDNSKDLLPYIDWGKTICKLKLVNSSKEVTILEFDSDAKMVDVFDSLSSKLNIKDHFIVPVDPVKRKTWRVEDESKTLWDHLPQLSLGIKYYPVSKEDWNTLLKYHRKQIAPPEIEKSSLKFEEQRSNWDEFELCEDDVKNIKEKVKSYHMMEISSRYQSLFPSNCSLGPESLNMVTRAAPATYRKSKMRKELGVAKMSSHFLELDSSSAIEQMESDQCYLPCSESPSPASSNAPPKRAARFARDLESLECHDSSVIHREACIVLDSVRDHSPCVDAYSANSHTRSSNEYDSNYSSNMDIFNDDDVCGDTFLSSHSPLVAEMDVVSFDADSSYSVPAAPAFLSSSAAQFASPQTTGTTFSSFPPPPPPGDGSLSSLPPPPLPPPLPHRADYLPTSAASLASAHFVTLGAAGFAPRSLSKPVKASLATSTFGSTFGSSCAAFGYLPEAPAYAPVSPFMQTSHVSQENESFARFDSTGETEKVARRDFQGFEKNHYGFGPSARRSSESSTRYNADKLFAVADDSSSVLDDTISMPICVPLSDSSGSYEELGSTATHLQRELCSKKVKTVIKPACLKRTTGKSQFAESLSLLSDGMYTFATPGERKKVMKMSVQLEQEESKEQSFVDHLLKLLQEEEDSGHMYWEMTDELADYVGFNKLMIKQAIIDQFVHIYGADSIPDLCRLVASILTAKKLIEKSGYEDLCNEKTEAESNFMAMLKHPETGPLFILALRFMSLFPLKKAKMLLAVIYFCLETSDRYPEFHEKLDNSLWKEAGNFFSFTNVVPQSG